MADIWSQLTGGRAHTGSWLGLPDFGATENIGARLGVAQNPGTGGVGLSNLIARTSNPSPTTSSQNMSTGGVLSGAGYNSNTPLNLKTNTVSGSGNKEVVVDNGGGGGGGGGGQGGYDPEAQARADLENALGEYDYQKEGLEAQSGQLDTQRTGALSELERGRGQAETEAATAKTEATKSTSQAQNKALSTAQDVTKKNRNVLRSLGILASSAGGEILTKAMTEYGTQAGQLQQGLVDRLGKIEDWWMGRQKDFDVAKKGIEDQYTVLKENIARDLRFNDRQRLTAVKAAAAAVQERMYQIGQQKVAYETAAKQYSDNILLKIAEMKMYQNPSADVSAIYNQLLSSAQGSQRQQVATSESEEERKKREEQSRLLGSLPVSANR